MQNVYAKQDRFVAVYLIYPFLLQIGLLLLMSNQDNLVLPFAINIFATILFTLSYVFKIKKTKYLFYHLVMLIVLQNLIVGLGNILSDNQTVSPNLKLLLIFKEAFAIVLLSSLVLKYGMKIKWLRYEKLVPLFIVVIAISFVLSHASMGSRLYYLRTFMIVFISYFTGRFLYIDIGDNKGELKNILRFIINVGIVSVFFGFLFLLISENSYIWNDWFHLGVILNAKRGQTSTAMADWSTFIGPYYSRRMFSFFFDPISLSYFIATALICSFLIEKKNTPVKMFLFSGLVFTVAKGATGIFLISFVWILLLYVLKLKPKAVVRFLMTIGALLFALLLHSSIKSSQTIHFAGFITPLLNSYKHPLGSGIGVGGDYGAMQSGVPAWFLSYTGAESFFGVLIYQLGYPGTLLILLFFIGMIKFLLNNAYTFNGHRYHYIVVSGITFAVLIAALFQENTLGLNYTGILMVIVGYSVSKAMTESTDSVTKLETQRNKLKAHLSSDLLGAD